jgi:ABC-type nitrate/sulfonate/bicarbonate transport system ATPase subunit
VIGPSVCGKTTLLRLLGGLLPDSSAIRVDGQPPSAAAAQRRIAWMAQSPALLPWLTVQQNIALAQRFLPAGSPPRLTPAEALGRVGLADSAAVYPFMLSGGMQQRLALARLLAQDAGLWLMDEPFAALDELTRERLAAELLALWQPLRPTVLWVTHHIHEALRLADRVLVLSERPARLALDVMVNLPRPRREADPEFQSLLAQLRTTLGLAVEAA